MKILRLCSSISLGILGMFFSSLLLFHGFLQGSEFVAFFLGIAILSLVIGLWPNVTELNIAGNIIKLNDVKGDVEKTLLELRYSTIEMLKFHLNTLSTLNKGRFRSGQENKADVIDNFWSLYKTLNELKLEVELSEELKKTLRSMLSAQLIVLKDLCPSAGIDYIDPEMEVPFPEADELRILISNNKETLICNEGYFYEGVSFYEDLNKLYKKFA